MANLTSNYNLLYQKGRVRITRTVLEIDRKQYQIRNINVVEWKRKRLDPRQPRIGIVIGILILIAASIIQGPMELYWVGLMVIITGCVWLSSLKWLNSVSVAMSPTHLLVIKMVGGEQQEFISRSLQEIQDVKETLEEAMARML